MKKIRKQEIQSIDSIILLPTELSYFYLQVSYLSPIFYKPFSYHSIVSIFLNV